MNRFCSLLVVCAFLIAIPFELSAQSAIDGAITSKDPNYDEPDFFINTEPAIKEGFKIIEFEPKNMSLPRHQIVSREFIQPLIKSIGGMDHDVYFDIASLDLTGDSVQELIIIPRIVGWSFEKADSLGTRFLIYRLVNGNWRIILDDYAYEMGVKNAGSESNPSYEIALIGEKNFRVFRWNNEMFEKK